MTHKKMSNDNTPEDSSLRASASRSAWTQLDTINCSLPSCPLISLCSPTLLIDKRLLREPNRHLITNRLHWQAFPAWPSSFKIVFKKSAFSTSFLKSVSEQRSLCELFYRQTKKGEGIFVKSFLKSCFKASTTNGKFWSHFFFSKRWELLDLIKVSISDI